MLVVHDQKKAERNLWQSVVDKATMEKDEAARKIIVDFEKKKKSAFRDVRDDPSRAEHALNGDRSSSHSPDEKQSLSSRPPGCRAIPA